MVVNAELAHRLRDTMKKRKVENASPDSPEEQAKKKAESRAAKPRRKQGTATSLPMLTLNYQSENPLRLDSRFSVSG